MVLDYIEAVNGSITITKRAGCTYCAKAQSADVAGSFDDIVKYVVGVDSNNNPVEVSLGKPDEKIIYYNKYNNRFYIYQDGYLNPFVEVGLQTTNSLVEGDSSKALSGNGARDLFLRTTTLITDMDWDGGSDNIIAQGSLLYNKTSKQLFYFHSKYLPSTNPQSGSQSDSQSGSQSGVVPAVQPIHVPASSNMNQKYIAFTPDPGLLYTDTNGNQYRWNQLSNRWLLISNSNGVQTISVNGGNQTSPDQYGNVNLTITGIKGDKGDKGDPGINGTQGPKGDTGQKGKDGLTPQINDEGYWVFVDDNGEHSTGVKAAGTKITIDREGYWCIDGVRTDY